MESLLKLEHVTICYNGEPVVHDVDLELNKGEILGVVGESGSGKSTIIKAIMGLLGNEGMVTEGDIWYKGKNIVDMPEKELRRLLGPEIAMVFQDSGAALCPIRTVGDQIYESMREHERISRKECAERTVRMMAKIGLKDGERVLQSYPFELSGGMNQRVGICISMLQNPSLLLADEPTSALDVTIQKQVVEEMLLMRKEYGTAMIVVTHNISVVEKMADKVLVLKNGKVKRAYEFGTSFKTYRYRKWRQMMTENKNILEVHHLKKSFTTGKKSFTAVEDVSFSLKTGEVLGIVGESGSGKSTVAKMITHLTEPTAGEIFLMERDITHAKGKNLREIYREMQMIFQTPAESFDPRCTLGDGIGESLRNMGISKKETRNRVEKLLLTCGLTPEYADRYPHQVSGGECQRAAIARALAVEPKVLICDEATSALDVTVQKHIMELLMKLKKENQLSFLFICHDLALVQMFCDRVIVMHDGHVEEEGTPEEIIENPKTEYTKRLIESVL